MSDRLQRINILVISIIVLYTVFILHILEGTEIVNPLVDSVFVYLTSLGFYRLLLLAIYPIINKSKFLLKIYWGKNYLDGIWSYSYTIEGAKDNKRYFGIWRFDQDLFSTKIIGFGLDDKFEIRSRVTSVTELIENQGFVDIVNKRIDSVDPLRNFYSTTSMIFEQNKGPSLFKFPICIRSQTIIYGGKLTGNVHKDLFRKHEKAECENDVINILKAENLG